MRAKLSSRPSPAMVVAVLALVMATAGTAAAAKVLITSSSQIKNGAVTGIDLQNGTVKGADLAANAVSSREIKNGAVDLGKLEPAARTAITGAQTSAVEVFRKEGPATVPKATAKRVATVSNLESGVYAIFAKTVISVGNPPTNEFFNQGNSASAHCVLDAGGDKDDTRAIIAGPGFNTPGQLSAQITHTFSGAGTVTLDCDSPDREWTASNTTIIAIRVAKAPRQSVDG
jgi:hypothetical protein